MTDVSGYQPWVDRKFPKDQVDLAEVTPLTNH